MTTKCNLGRRSRSISRSRDSRSGSIMFVTGIVLVGFIPLSNGLTLEFMESLCGTTYTFDTSFQLDSGTGITYKNLLDCSLTVTAPAGHYILSLVTRFELEAAVTGTCTDYLDVHNGVDTTAAKLNSEQLCGWGTNIPSNFTSSAESMTLRLVTDNSGVKFGFNMVFAAVTDAPCATTDFACTNGICIDSSLRCDNYNQCGDNSDEDNCETYGSSSGINVVMVAVIAAVVCIVIAVVAAVIIYKIRDRNRWMKFVNSRLDHDDDDGIVEPPPSYPITHMYHKGPRGNPELYSAPHTPKSTLKIESHDEQGKNQEPEMIQKQASDVSNLKI